MKTYIWGLPTRIFHTCLVLFIAITWISAEDDFMQIHSAFGYAVGILVIFRLIWGVIGPKYSHFRDFNFSIKNAIEFSKNVFTHINKKYLGHNPAASIVLFIMLFIIIIAVITGVLALGEQEAKGFFSNLSNTSLKSMELFEGLHEFFADFMLVFIFMHVVGVLTDRLLHKEDGTAKSILTGYKNIQGQNSKINIFQTIISIIFFVLMILVMYFTFTNMPIFYS